MSNRAAPPAEPPTTTGALLPSADRPRPLHPYSTPPYGEPGPWALAPPVQHPVVVSRTRRGSTGPYSRSGYSSPNTPGT